jgi:hypothetical protein
MKQALPSMRSASTTTISEMMQFDLPADRCSQTCLRQLTTRPRSSNASIDDHLNSRIAFLHHRTQRRSLHSSSNINRSEAAMAATIPVSSRCGQAMTPLSMSKLTRTVTATEV